MMRNNTLATKGRMLLLPAVLLAFNISFAGWELLQNSPTTNDLHSVFFIDDNTGWIAGDNSTIYKTTNSGESWVQQTSPEASNFQCIVFVSAVTGWACGTGGTVIKTTDGGANWFSQSFTGSKFNSMDFYGGGGYFGYIVGDFGNIYKTIDGGSTWTPQVSGVNLTLHQIIIDKFNGFVFVVGDNAIILKTIDFGNNWEIKNGPELFSQNFYSIQILRDQYSPPSIVSTGTLTKYSIDEGETWNLVGFSDKAVYSIEHFGYNGYNTIYTGVGANGYIITSTNLGNLFEQKESPTTQNLYSVYCKPDNYDTNQKDANFIWAVGKNGTILKNIPDWLTYHFPAYELFEPYHCKSVYFTNADTGFIVGDFEIIKTVNSGKTWEGRYFYDDTLNSVYFTDANTGYVVGNAGKIMKTSDCGTNWVILASGTIENLYSVYFTDAYAGYVAGTHGKILKTTNSGTNWDTLTSGTSNSLTSVYFTDASTGYIVGQFGTILKTTNSGINWTTQHKPNDSGLKSVHFINGDTGYICGTENIFKTTDGGANWLNPIESLGGAVVQFYSVHFIDAYVGYASVWDGIYKSIDGGINWVKEDLRQLVFFNGLSSMEFVIENNTAVGFAVGDEILRTSFEYFGGEPGGNSGSYPGWVQVNSGTTDAISGVDYINPFVAFAVGVDLGSSETGVILRTINGGQTWTRQQSNITSLAGLNDVSFADVNTGLAVGYSGIITGTTNAGSDWVQQTSGTPQWIHAVDMLDINNAFACGSSNTILHTSNGGLNWETQISGTPTNLLGIDYINPTTATAVGSPGIIIRTTDAGLNWVSQTGGGNLGLTCVKFIDVNNGIAISYEGPVLRTTNGGVDWVQTDSLSGSAMSISYIDSANAFIVTSYGGYDNRIYHSIDGGLSWILQTTDNANYAYGSVSFADANNGLITGAEGMILRTSNGGVFSGTNTAHNRNGLNLPIGDFQNTDDSININITGNSNAYTLSNTYGVTRIYLKIDTVLHTNDGDLEFYLEHNGIIDTLIYRNGGSGDNFFGTFLNDETNFPLLSGTAPFRGSFKPYRPLSKFNGQNPNGTWRLRIYDGASGNTGTLEAWSLTLKYQTLTGITDEIKIPTQYLLSQNYPNPFNPSTTIQFDLLNASFVTLKIFNLLGQEVAILINEKREAGQHSVQWNARGLASGVYFYRLYVHPTDAKQTNDFVQTKKLLLLR